MVMGDVRQGRGRTLVFTGIALAAFAANSVLCRLALGRRSIDPATFATVRLVSGAVMLLAIRAASRARSPRAARAGWPSAVMLFLYAVPFSFAYRSLHAGTGALILFGSVQVSMIVAALRSGERFRVPEAFGLVLALGGLVYLVSPGLAAPSPAGSALMAIAGISWGLYSLRGRGAGDPLGDTASSFLRSVPLAAGVTMIAHRGLHLSPGGFALAVASGALASGVGYVIWYAAVRGLTAIRAATVQLAVPVLAAAGGVLFLSEGVSLRLILSAVLILGGVAMAVAGRGAPVATAPAD